MTYYVDKIASVKSSNNFSLFQAFISPSILQRVISISTASGEAPAVQLTKTDHVIFVIGEQLIINLARIQAYLSVSMIQASSTWQEGVLGSSNFDSRPTHRKRCWLLQK